MGVRALFFKRLGGKFLQETNGAAMAPLKIKT